MLILQVELVDTAHEELLRLHLFSIVEIERFVHVTVLELEALVGLLCTEEALPLE